MADNHPTARPRAAPEGSRAADHVLAKLGRTDTTYGEAGDYAKRNPSWHVEDSGFKAQKVIEMLGDGFSALRSVAEVGCGAGEILRLLSEQHKDIQFTGYEISPYAYELAQTRSHPRLQFKLKDIATDDAFFDCLLCMDVMEHVEDYIGFLRSLRLRADLKVFNIPLDLSVSAVARAKPLQHARDSIGHLHYFSRETALATLQHCGYQVIDERYSHPFDRVAHWYEPRQIPSLVRKLAAKASPGLCARLLGGDSLLVVAR